jgi:beta-aspartyl-peptidase (threonine type)
MLALAIHGGAGTILRGPSMPAGREHAYRDALKLHLLVGWSILEAGGSALDAVEAAVRSLEDDILFNAGRGAVFTRDATHELDASIMCGRTLDCGAVAGVPNVRNPITLARAIMERSEHVLMAGEGARRFAVEEGIELAGDEYFYSQERFEQLEVARAALRVQLDHAPDEPLPGQAPEDSTGTVGAVALDAAGDLAAATSTGGMTNKRVGRVGDTPIIGGGTYANNATCAVSCTGHGELIMKAVAAYDVSALMEYAGKSLAEACDIVIHRKLASEHGTAGLIAVDREGNIALPFNSTGMYRAALSSNSELIVSIW